MFNTRTATNLANDGHDADLWVESCTQVVVRPNNRNSHRAHGLGLSDASRSVKLEKQSMITSSGEATPKHDANVKFVDFKNELESMGCEGIRDRST